MKVFLLKKKKNKRAFALQHVALLQELKKDLENVFSRIRFLKSTLANQYPEAFAKVKLQEVNEESEEE